MQIYAAKFSSRKRADIGEVKDFIEEGYAHDRLDLINTYFSDIVALAKVDSAFKDKLFDEFIDTPYARSEESTALKNKLRQMLAG